jgi:hypothetical protein
MLRTLPVILVLGTVASAEPPPPSAARVSNIDDVRRKLGLTPNFASSPRIGDIKIAVLDSGFDGLDGKRPYLPKSAVVVEHYDPEFVRRNALGDPAFKKGFLPGNIHGRLMAQIAWETTGKSPHGPQFYLLNANGPTMFRRAVRYAIEQKCDIVLFSGTFEGAGNYDGRGPINAAVDDAVAAGIIWVNAAGNTGGMVYNGPVELDANGFLKTPLRFTNRLDENAVTITLTWNDYRDAEDAGTDKDLDLIVEDWRGRVVGESKLRQIAVAREAGDGETKNPRERVVLTDLAAVPAGKEYRIRVKANGGVFGPRDRVRVLLSPSRTTPVTDPDSGQSFLPMQFLDATPRGEIYPPADHAGVVTVGDASTVSSVGPTADGRLKPDVILAESVARFSNGEETVGSSNAAAFFAGVAAVLKAAEPSLNAAHLKRWVKQVDKLRTETRTPAPPAGRVSSPVVTLSPNEQRALRYAEASLEEKRLRGEANPKVVVSSGGSALRPAPPASVPSSPPSSRVGAAADVLVHTPWATPTPRALAELVRGK